MNESAAMLKAILTNPADDGLRLIHADWLAEHGQEERGELIRVQCRIAAMCEQHRRGEAEHPEFQEMLSREAKVYAAVLHPQFEWLKSLGIDYSHCVWRRGWLAEITCSWQSWLAHHERVWWSPRQTVECGRCVGWTIGRNKPPYDSCPDCRRYICSLCRDDPQFAASGLCRECVVGGRIPRPFPETVESSCPYCQGQCDDGHRICAGCHGTGRITTPATPMPIEEVTLTTWPDGYWVTRHPEVRTYSLTDPRLTNAPGILTEIALAAEWPGLRFHLPNVAREYLEGIT